MCLHQRLIQVMTYDGILIMCHECPTSVLIHWIDMPLRGEIIERVFGKALTD